MEYYVNPFFRIEMQKKNKTKQNKKNHLLYTIAKHLE